MITIVTRWESGQMSPLKEWRLWRRLKGAFRVKRFIFVPVHDYMAEYPIEQYDNMKEALEAVGDGERAFLEPDGQNSVNDLPQGDIILVLGNEHMHNKAHSEISETYHIKTPQRTTFMAEQAASIALAIRHGQ